MPDTATQSRLISLLGYIAVGCLLAMPLSVLAVRLGVHFSIGLGVFALSGFVGLLTALLLLLVALLPRFRGERGRALRSAAPALPPALLLAAILITGGKYPPIHDITTDTADPPVFDSGVYYRGDDANSVAIKPEVIEVQMAHYPDLHTLQTDLDTGAAFTRATEVANSMGWEIYNSDPANGRIEAASTSFWFGFTDDIVIRISRGDDGDAEVDLRSVSRVGQGDLGANAARIKAFLDSF
ncbi:MAG: DUF1499 domain-containing protein [Halieaceae bacterium]|nr:DUF1499 domain-containing protein [Halieaceae bacterium]